MSGEVAIGLVQAISGFASFTSCSRLVHFQALASEYAGTVICLWDFLSADQVIACDYSGAS